MDLRPAERSLLSGERYDTGATITAFPSPVRNASGIAYGAGSVWPAANRLPAATYRHDAKTGHCLADLVFPDGDRGGVHGIEWVPTDPAALATLPPEEPPPPPLRREAPGGELIGQRGTAGTLWVTRPGLRIIQWIDAETGELLRTIPFPEERSHGIYWDEADGSIVCVETNHNHIYRLDATDGAIRDVWVVDSIDGPRELVGGALHGDETTPPVRGTRHDPRCRGADMGLRRGDELGGRVGRVSVWAGPNPRPLPSREGESAWRTVAIQAGGGHEWSWIAAPYRDTGHAFAGMTGAWARFTAPYGGGFSGQGGGTG